MTETGAFDLLPSRLAELEPVATADVGYLVIADLTGYVAHISGSEIEHPPAIAGDLPETIVGRLEPPFRLAKFEGPKDGPLPASRRTMTAMLGGSASDSRRLRLKVGAFRQTLVKQMLCERWWSVEWRIERPRGQGANLIKQTLYERCRAGWVALEWPSRSGRWSS
jgi:hypothetical protein